jgi:hypothetical protein
VKQITDPFAEAEVQLKQKLLAWEQHKAEVVRVEQERLEAEFRKKVEEQKKLDDIFGGRGAQEVVVPLPVMNTAPTTGETAKSVVREAWDWEVLDIGKVPKEFVAVNTVGVNFFLREFIRNRPNDIPSIEGIKFFKTKSVSVRG